MRLRLHILNAPETESQRTLDPPGGLIGRSTDSAIPLLYDSVSRQHVELRHDGQHWWLHNLSQTSPTVVDEKPVETGQPQRLQQRGTLKLGRIFFTYQQEALPQTVPAKPPAAPLNEEVTLVLPRAAVLIPPAVVAQMAPVRAAEPPPLSPPPTLVRRPSGGGAPGPLPKEAERKGEGEAPLGPLPTVVRRPGGGSAPESLPKEVKRKGEGEAPLGPLPTVVRRPSGVVPPPLPPPAARAAAPPTLVLRSPSTAAAPAPAPGTAAPRMIEHQLEPLSVAELVPLEQMQEERARHRRECQRLTAELAQLKQENSALREDRALLSGQLDALQSAPPPANQTAGASIKLLQEKALELLLPFSRSLEQAGEALRKEDPAQARALLRSASFALADLRDLFQS